MDATWMSLGALCRERDWSRRRLIDEWQNKRVLIRTIPPGRENKIDLHDPRVVDSLDIKASEISYFDEEVAEEERFTSRYLIVVSDGKVTVGIEAMLPPEELPNDSAGLGYQATRVARALDHLEAGGLKLSDYTDAELRRLVLKRIPKRDGEALPSRQTLDRMIQRHRAK
jgi:hypothetical protein